jgi:hypothetical protein
MLTINLPVQSRGIRSSPSNLCRESELFELQTPQYVLRAGVLVGIKSVCVSGELTMSILIFG